MPQVASAALDVYDSEPPPESSRELLQHPRLVCTPHLGASTEEAQVRTSPSTGVVGGAKAGGGGGNGIHACAARLLPLVGR